MDTPQGKQPTVAYLQWTSTRNSPTIFLSDLFTDLSAPCCSVGEAALQQLPIAQMQSDLTTSIRYQVNSTPFSSLHCRGTGNRRPPGKAQKNCVSCERRRKALKINPLKNEFNLPEGRTPCKLCIWVRSSLTSPVGNQAR